MYRELNTGSRREVSESEFVKAYRDSAETATLRSVLGADPGDTEERDSSTVVPVPVTAQTVAFGTVEEDLELPYADGGIAWDPSLVFPGLRKGEHLESRVELAPRAPIFAADGETLAEGPAEAREHPLGSAMIDVTGEIGMAEEDELPALARHGFPPGTPVGDQRRRAGIQRPARRHARAELLLAVADSGGSARIIAKAEPGAGAPVKTTIDPDLQEAAVSALAGRAGGVAALDPAEWRHPGARRPGVLGPATTRLDLQDADHDRRPAEGGGLTRRHLRNHRRRERRRPLHQQRQRRAAAAAPSGKRSPSPATPTSPRSDRRSATTTSSRPPNGSGSTRRRASTRQETLEARSSRPNRRSRPKSAKKSTSG